MNANHFVVAIKWTKLEESSPGYLNGFALNEILNSPNVEESLSSRSILPQYFNEELYRRWINVTLELANSRPIYGFSSKKSSDNSTSYSVSIFESEESYNEMREQNSKLFEIVDSCRNEYANLMRINPEVKKGNVSLDVDDFIAIITSTADFAKLESLFNSM